MVGLCPKISNDELKLFCDFVEQECGVALGPEKAYLFESRLASLMAAWKCASFSELYLKLKDDLSQETRDRIVDAITTKETRWFRDPGHWLELEQVLLPALASVAASEGRSVRAWSCACSTGQEPYSLAMLAMKVPALASKPGPGISIVATDISAEALHVAREARYGQIAMHRGKLDHRFRTHFAAEGASWRLDKGVQEKVRFRKFNLMGKLGALGSFDLVLCRYLLIYWSRPFRVAFLDRLSRIMKPGAILMLGASEGLYGESQAFQVVEGENCIYYKRSGTGGDA